MNRVYTLTFAAPSVALVESTASALTARGVPVQDQGGQSVSFRVEGVSPEHRDRQATFAIRAVMLGAGVRWELATGMGVHRRVVGARA